MTQAGSDSGMSESASGRPESVHGRPESAFGRPEPASESPKPASEDLGAKDGWMYRQMYRFPRYSTGLRSPLGAAAQKP